MTKSRLEMFSEIKDIMAADTAVRKYDAISDVIFKQRAEMAKAVSVEQIAYVLYLTKGYLHGLMLSRVISAADVNTYMKDLTRFANACGDTL